MQFIGYISGMYFSILTVHIRRSGTYSGMLACDLLWWLPEGGSCGADTCSSCMSYTAYHGVRWLSCDILNCIDVAKCIVIKGSLLVSTCVWGF